MEQGIAKLIKYCVENGWPQREEAIINHALRERRIPHVHLQGLMSFARQALKIVQRYGLRDESPNTRKEIKILMFKHTEHEEPAELLELILHVVERIGIIIKEELEWSELHPKGPAKPRDS